MQKKVTFSEYYGQFATPDVIALVGARIGKERILSSNEPHFNDIPLAEWDALAEVLRNFYLYLNRSLILATAGSEVAQADYVCIAKEAARRIKVNAD